MRIKSLDCLDTDDPLVLGFVGQHRRSGDVTDCVDAGDICLVELIDHNDAAVGLHAELFQPQIFNVADHADRRNHAFDREGL